MLQAPMGSLRVTVCYGLMSHNNGNLWFTLFDSLFYASYTLNGLVLRCSPLAPHISLSLFYSSLWAQSPLLAFGAPPSQVREAQEPHQGARDSFNSTSTEGDDPSMSALFVFVLFKDVGRGSREAR